MIPRYLMQVPPTDRHYIAMDSDAWHKCNPRQSRPKAAPCLRDRYARTTRERCAFMHREGTAFCDGCPGANNFHRGEQPSG